MQYQHSKPGPRATSCLTCRQRRKKCDLSRPFCDRCIKGKFKCLGYDDDVEVSGPMSSRLESGRIVPGLPGLTPGQQQPIVAPALEPELHDSEPRNTSTTELSQDRFPSVFFPMFNDPGPSVLGIALLHRATRTASISQVDNRSNLSAPASERCFNSLWPQDQSFGINPPRSSVSVAYPASSYIRIRPDLVDAINNVCRILNMLRGSIPRSVDSRASMREGYLTYVLTQYLMQRVSKWFQPPPSPHRQHLLAQLKRSKSTIWVMYLGARLFQALAGSPRDTAIQPYMYWIDQFDQQVARDMRRDPSIQEVVDRLMTQLELVFLKFVAFDTLAGYSVLQRSLPLFLHVVSVDSSLYVEQRGNLVVSFSRALTAPRSEIRRFVMYDIGTALVLGLTPLVEYEYEYGDVAVDCQPPLEWVHGIPVALLASIAQVNAWRSGARDMVDNWQSLEIRVLGCKPAHVYLEGQGLSTESVARLAAQESWRHAALIYIYMGMCGVSSDDPRVQSSVRQIVKLLDVVSCSSIEVQMFIHCVVAGVAARYEKHRSIVRARLLSFQNTRIWFLRGTEFIKVLEHLWHSLGKNGAPVTWDDYVRSRCIIIPI